MEDESTPPPFPRDFLLLSCMLLLFSVTLLSPLYVATTAPAETSEATGSGQITTTWKVNAIVEQSEWSNATLLLDLENSSFTSSTELHTTPSIFEPSGDDVFHRMNRVARIQMFLLAVLAGALIARCQHPVRSKTAQHGPTIIAAALIALVGMWGLSGLVSDAGEQAATVLEVKEVPAIDKDFFGGGIVKQDEGFAPFDVEISWRPSTWLFAPLLLFLLSLLLVASEVRILFKESVPNPSHPVHTSIGDWAPTAAGCLVAVLTLVALFSPWYDASTLNEDSSEFLQGTGNQSATIGLWSASQVTENEDLVTITESLDRGPTSALAPLSERLDSLKWWLALSSLLFIAGSITVFLPENRRPNALPPLLLVVASSLFIFMGAADLGATNSGFSSLDGEEIAVFSSIPQSSGGDGILVTTSTTINHDSFTQGSGEEVAAGSLSTFTKSGHSLGAHAVVLILFISFLLLTSITLSTLFAGWENSDFDLDDWLVAQRGRMRAFGPLAAVILIGASITSSLLIIERTQQNPFLGTSTSQTLVVTPDSITTQDLVYDAYEVTPKFECTNGDKIQAILVKDGVEDCDDGSDESTTATKPETVLIWSSPSGGSVAHESSENDGSSLSDQVLDGRLIRIGSFALALLLFAFAAAMPNNPSPSLHRRRHLVGVIGWGILTFFMLILLFQYASIAEAFADDILAGFTGDARDAITNLERGRCGRFSSDAGLSYDWSPGSSSLWTLASFIICASIMIAHLIEFTERRNWKIIEAWSTNPTLSSPSGSEDILPFKETTLDAATFVVGILIVLGVGAAVVGPWWSSSSIYLLPNEPTDDESQLPAGSTNSELMTSIGLWGLRVDELPDNDTRAQLLTDGEPVNTTRTQNGGEIDLLDTGRLITSMRAPAITALLLSLALTFLLFMRWRQISLPFRFQEISKFLVALLAVCLVLTIEIGITEFETDIERTLRLDGRPESGAEGTNRATISVQMEAVPGASVHEEISWGLEWGWSGLLLARLCAWVFAAFTLTRFFASNIDFKSHLLLFKHPANASFTSLAIVLTIIGAGMGNVFAVATGISEKVGSDDGLRTWEISLSSTAESFFGEQTEMADDESVQFSVDLSQLVPMSSDIRQVLISISCDEGATAFGGGEDPDSIDFTISPPPDLSPFLESGLLSGTVECNSPSSQTEWQWPGVDDVPETIDSVSSEEAIAPYQFTKFEGTWTIEITSNVEGEGIPAPGVQGPTGDDQLYSIVEMEGESFAISASRQT